MKAYTLVCAETLGVRDKVFEQCAVEFMMLRKGSSELQLISVQLMPNSVAEVNSMDHM